MKKSIIVLLFIIKTISAFTQNPDNLDTAWVNSYGGLGSDVGKDLKETSDKGFIIAGNSSSFGNGNTSFYIIKTDSMGLHQWSKSFGSTNNDYCHSVDIAHDGGFFFSGYSNHNIEKGYDGYLVKTDNLGNVLWTKSYGGSDWDFIYNSCLMPDGGLLLCGETNSNSQGGSDGYLIRTDLNGDTLWSRKIGSPGDDAFYCVEQNNGHIYVAGKTHDTINNRSFASIFKLNFNGDILSQDFFYDNSSDDMKYLDMSITSDGYLLLCGKRGNSILGNPLLRKVDTTNFTQINYNPNNQEFHLNGVIEGYNHDVYVVGLSTGGLGGYAANYIRYDANLDYLHNGTFGGAKDEEGAEIIKTSRGYAFVGSTNSYGNLNENIDHNVYLVIFNKQELENEFYIHLNEFHDNLSPVGIAENRPGSVIKTTVYPNPVSDQFTIMFSNTNLNGKVIKYQLVDVQGKIVAEEFIPVSDNRIMPEKKDLNSGLYTYRLSLNSVFIHSGIISVQ